MTVYRIAATGYARDLSGEGARLFGGRWNHKGIPCIYTAQSRALAVLEYTVNVSAANIPRALSISTFEIPDKEIYTVNVVQLPGNWQQSPAPSATKDFGTALLKKAQYLVIKIPSIVIPEEWNYLINPAHSEMRFIRLTDCVDYPYDIRIKLN